MAFLDLPTELILLILPSLSESDLTHLLQVHSSLFNIVLPYLYKRHIHDNTKGQDQEAQGLALFRCTITGNTAAVSRFLHHGADPNALISAASIRQVKANILSSSSSGAFGFLPWHNMQTPLNIAANMGDDALVSLLLSYGARVDGFSPKGHQGTGEGRHTVQPAVEGVYPLNRAVSSSSEGAAEIVRFLLDNGADIEAANSYGENTGHGQRLLNQVIRQGTIDTLRLLLTRGVVTATAQALSNKGVFRIWLMQRCDAEVVRLLLQHGYFEPDSINGTLMAVMRARRLDILQLFMDSGVDPNTRTGIAGLTLLHTAVIYCAVRSMPIETGLASTTVCRDRPMSHALNLVRKIESDPSQQISTCIGAKVERCAPEEIVRCLIRGGADVNGLDARGASPLALAEMCPLSVQQMLIDCGGK
uniref:Ankyrin-2 n=1 Tax=Talaromyces marneffei PM1 TaxID=1077442 RepID=A0A093Y5Y1_TALMA